MVRQALWTSATGASIRVGEIEDLGRDRINRHLEGCRRQVFIALGVTMQVQLPSSP